MEFHPILSSCCPSPKAYNNKWHWQWLFIFQHIWQMRENIQHKGLKKYYCFIPFYDHNGHAIQFLRWNLLTPFQLAWAIVTKEVWTSSHDYGGPADWCILFFHIWRTEYLLSNWLKWIQSSWAVMKSWLSGSTYIMPWLCTSVSWILFLVSYLVE